MLRTTILFLATALAEIIGCFLPYLWLRKGGTVWLLLPAAASLALFVWLLSLRARIVSFDEKTVLLGAASFSSIEPQANIAVGRIIYNPG